MRIYIDTSVISSLCDAESRIKDITNDFFRTYSASRTVFYISDLVTREIEKTKDASKRVKLINTISEYDFEIIAITEEVGVLAELYIKEKIIPVKYIADAMHIAVASVYNVPILVSWNFQHMVKYKTRIEINRVNRSNNYPQIEICSPEEM